MELDKYQKMIVRYETARADVSQLKKQRRELIHECEMIGFIDRPDGFGEMPTGTLCLAAAYDNTNPMPWDEDDVGGEYSSYRDAVESMHHHGKCCDACYKSWNIKIGDLAAARQEFGNAKRSINYMGQKLIKDNESK